jgi:hypothetical protein
MDEFVGNLNALIRQAVADQAGQDAAPPRLRFKVPIYDGKGDVEMFIEQLEQLIENQEWDGATSVLKAREGLTGPARICGRHGTWAAIAGSLRLHYGLTQTEAEARLGSLRLQTGQSLADYGAEVERLVGVAYADTPDVPRQRLTMERFRLGLADPGLQGHLLARQPGTLDEMIRAGNEYLQVTKRSGTVVKGRQVEDIEEREQELAPQRSVTQRVWTPGPEQVMASLLKAVQDLTTEVAGMKQGLPGPSRDHKENIRGERKNARCWGCGEEGHRRRDCPTNPWKTKAGNDNGPRQ